MASARPATGTGIALGGTSLRRKLIVIIMTASAVVLVLAVVAYGFFLLSAFRERRMRQFTAQARMIAENCQAAVAFEDAGDAAEVLRSLSVQPSVVYAEVTKADGNVLAVYRRDGFASGRAPGPEPGQAQVDGQWLTVRQQIVMDGRKIGAVFLRSDMSEIEAFRKQIAASGFGVFAVVLLGAFLLSTQLQRLISGPIEHLTRTARRVSETRDYTIRAAHQSADEVGQLAQAFNEMLAEVERRDVEVSHLRSYLDNIINSMPSALVGVDREGIVTQWNQETERVTGVGSRTAMGRRLVDVVPYMADLMTQVRAAMVSRTSQRQTKIVRQVAGEKRYNDVTVYPLVTNGVEGAVIRVDDVTERVRIEEMMVQSEKMMSVGGLAAGMAHEINNPLAGMMQTAQVMSERLSDLELPANRRAAEEAGTTIEAIHRFMTARGIFPMLTRIRESGLRAADIVANVLSFARKSDSATVSCDLAKLLDQTADLAGSDYDLKRKYDFRQIAIVRDYEASLPPVRCEPAKIQQVLLNVLRNGAEAMQDERMAGGPEKTPRFIFRVRHMRETGMVRIEIADNGPGMDEATRKRVFEPFFTTKSPTGGTGLGLSVSYFIVTENHRGEMRVESTPGDGATFIVELPVERATT